MESNTYILFKTYSHVYKSRYHLTAVNIIIDARLVLSNVFSSLRGAVENSSLALWNLSSFFLYSSRSEHSHSSFLPPFLPAPPSLPLPLSFPSFLSLSHAHMCSLFLEVKLVRNIIQVSTVKHDNSTVHTTKWSSSFFLPGINSCAWPVSLHPTSPHSTISLLTGFSPSITL